MRACVRACVRAPYRKPFIFRVLHAGMATLIIREILLSFVFIQYVILSLEIRFFFSSSFFIFFILSFFLVSVCVLSRTLSRPVSRTDLYFDL